MKRLESSLMKLSAKIEKEKMSDVINNYFFNIYNLNSDEETKVRFSDINVMCCFAAGYICCNT